VTKVSQKMNLKRRSLKKRRVLLHLHASALQQACFFIKR